MAVDYLVVGTGLTGAVIARTLADAGRNVLLLERREHVGGNVHDHEHPSGIRIHTYGPHYFRTSSERIWSWVRRFDDFYEYRPSLLSFVDDEFAQWPIARSYIVKKCGQDWKPEFNSASPNNLEEAALSLMPKFVYERFVKEYNEKQWGADCRELTPELCKRFDVREDDEPLLKPSCKYQGIPINGYANWMRKMLDGIPVMTGINYCDHRQMIKPKHFTVFTGPIDEFFDYNLGKLKYRGQRRQHDYLTDTKFKYPCGQVNNPQHENGEHIRTLEWKHMMPASRVQSIVGTVLTTETPFTPTDPSMYEYPFPDQANTTLYDRYRRQADGLPQVMIAGRLGEYRYYDMDQAIGRAMVLAERLLNTKSIL